MFQLRRGFLHATSTRSSLRAFHASRTSMMPQISFNLADIGEGIAEVEVLQWFVKPGDKISQFQNLVEVQSDKATVEITSRFDGVVTKLHYDVGGMAKVGSALIDLDVSDEIAAAHNAGAASKKPAAGAKKVEQLKKAAIPTPIKSLHAPVVPTPQAPVSVAPASLSSIVRTKTGKVLTTPSVRRLAREHNIDLEDIPVEGDRILKGDILNYIRELSEAKFQPAQAASQASAESSHEVAGTTSSSKGVEFLTESQVVPVNLVAAERGIKITYLPLMIKAASLALKYYPVLNSSVSECEGFITLHAHHNISVAMDTPKGLLVPNIKNVESKSILEIAEDLSRLQGLATAGKLGPNDLTGGTFSLSNIGSIGGTYMGPVIMVPQVAIGAIGKIQTLPRFNKAGEVVPVKIMNVSWSGDHRIIDGATMARFSTKWKNFLENPTSMLSELK
ncbi:hypothetical protein DYB32_007932 [Aphanomyces invadans]|uniref:Dihydrolipoamide acetyltransferase component of pyruvate dehydrogenase complex n=1 Tax=Aphanomyces invadans TaxID=157072 RepID=A0A3R6VNS6_9STRA|nr:hypothetical protein DYB32_007932 [Aphanomyces invadans]